MEGSFLYPSVFRFVNDWNVPRPACPVLTGCLPAGRQGRRASHYVKEE